MKMLWRFETYHMCEIYVFEAMDTQGLLIITELPRSHRRATKSQNASGTLPEETPFGLASRS